MPLPLHVFEPRYRKMIKDALAGSKVIGMVLLKAGWEDDYLGRPPIYPIGCAGELQQCESLPDGRFNIVLRGLTRFRVLEELGGEPYRLARTEALVDLPSDAGELTDARRSLVAELSRATDGTAVVGAQPDLPDDVFVNALCQSLPLEAVEQQSLLDCGSVLERCGRLQEILEFKLLERSAYGRPGSDTRH
jgi:uncharacterized protein